MLQTPHFRPVRGLPSAGRMLRASLGAALLMAQGCSDESADAPCSGHGTPHGDHCHCDPGFRPDPSDALRCTPASDAGGDAGSDAGRTDDAGADAPGPDASEGLDGASAALRRELTEAPSRARFGTDPNNDRVWQLTAMGQTVVLRIEIWESDGGPTQPGTFELGADETSYATCGLCIVLETGCVAHGDHAHCERTFLPTAVGRVELQQLGETGGHMQGRLRDLVLREVRIGSSLETTDVPGGQTLHIESWSFLAAVQEDEPAAECGGHGHSHGTYCHCDPGYRTDPADPMNCIRA